MATEQKWTKNALAALRVQVARDWRAYQAGKAAARREAGLPAVAVASDPDCSACNDDQFWIDLGYTQAERRAYCGPRGLNCPGWGDAE